MSPSRGPEPPSPTQTETKANIRSSSALHSAKRNLHYLLAPNSPHAPHPAHLRTRALLRALRFIGVFLFWRLVRYAKYAVVGSVVAALGASAMGGVVGGAAFVLAPPTIASSLGVGIVWMVARWGVGRMGARGRGKEESVGDGRGAGAVSG